MPLGYLGWLFEEATNLRPPLFEAVHEEIATRIGATLASQPTALPAAPPALAPAVRALVKAGFRQLTRERHPDVGGTDNAMRNVLDAHAWLESALR